MLHGRNHFNFGVASLLHNQYAQLQPTIKTLVGARAVVDGHLDDVVTRNVGGHGTILEVVVERAHHNIAQGNPIDGNMSGFPGFARAKHTPISLTWVRSVSYFM